MSAESELEKLRRDVQSLMDRQAILDCIARHAPLSLDETPERW